MQVSDPVDPGVCSEEQHVDNKTLKEQMLKKSFIKTDKQLI